jgi:hypothetical protein
MRNEFAEKFQPVLRVDHELNRGKQQVSAKRKRGIPGKTRKRSVELRGDHAKETGPAARRSRLVRGKGAACWRMRC